MNRPGKIKKFIKEKLNGWKEKTVKLPKSKGIINTNKILLFDITLSIKALFSYKDFFPKYSFF